MGRRFRRSVRVAAAVLLGLPACSSTPGPERPEAAADRFESWSERMLAEARVSQELPLPEVVHFDFDRADLRAEARQALEARAELLRQHPDWRLSIEGHADERGSERYNLALGQARAAAARAYLLELGIEGARLSARSLGESQPALPGHDEGAWQANRRAELRLAKL